MASLDRLLNCVKKEHNYTIQRTPVKPVKLVVEAASDKTTTTGTDTCQVCYQNVSRYTCPRCSIGYCSLECYNCHGKDSNGENYCRESFYRDRTSQSVDLQVREHLDDTKQLIQRVYDENKESISEISTFSQDELLEIMKYLEDGNETKLQSLMKSERIRQAMSESLNNGELLDYVLDSWTPWWRPETITSTSGTHDDDELTEEVTLDEKILKIPPLTSLHPHPSKLPPLQFNLIDILYATCWTLRLYYGRSNAIESSIDAADTLLNASVVLSNDARWETLSEALSACTIRSTESLQHGCNTPWHVLVSDVALICENPRFVAKALLGATDILREAAAVAKRAEYLDAASRFRKCRKKIEFFLSWCREAANSVTIAGLARQIETWSADWKIPERDEYETQANSRIRLAKKTSLSTSMSDRIRRDKSELFREVSTKQLDSSK